MCYATPAPIERYYVVSSHYKYAILYRKNVRPNVRFPKSETCPPVVPLGSYKLRVLVKNYNIPETKRVQSLNGLGMSCCELGGRLWLRNISDFPSSLRCGAASTSLPWSIFRAQRSKRIRFSTVNTSPQTLENTNNIKNDNIENNLAAAQPSSVKIIRPHVYWPYGTRTRYPTRINRDVRDYVNNGCAINNDCRHRKIKASSLFEVFI